MRKLAYDPAGDPGQHIVAEVQKDLGVGGESQLRKVLLHVHDFEQHLQEVVEAGGRDEGLELVEYFIHPPEEDEPVVREVLDQVDGLLDQLVLVRVVHDRLLRQVDDSAQNQLRVLLVGDPDEQCDGLQHQGLVLGFQAVEQGELIWADNAHIHLRQLLQAADTEVNIQVALVVEHLADCMLGVLEEELSRVDVGDEGDALLHDGPVEGAEVVADALANALLQHIVDQFAGGLVVPAQLLHDLQQLDLGPGRGDVVVVVVTAVTVVHNGPEDVHHSAQNALVLKGVLHYQLLQH